MGGQIGAAATRPGAGSTLHWAGNLFSGKHLPERSLDLPGWHGGCILRCDADRPASSQEEGAMAQADRIHELLLQLENPASPGTRGSP